MLLRIGSSTLICNPRERGSSGSLDEQTIQIVEIAFNLATRYNLLQESAYVDPVSSRSNRLPDSGSTHLILSRSAALRTLQFLLSLMFLLPATLRALVLELVFQRIIRRRYTNPLAVVRVWSAPELIRPVRTHHAWRPQSRPSELLAVQLV